MTVSAKAQAKVLPTDWSEESSLSNFLAEQSLLLMLCHTACHTDLGSDRQAPIGPADAAALPKVNTAAVVL